MGLALGTHTLADGATDDIGGGDPILEAARLAPAITVLLAVTVAVAIWSCPLPRQSLEGPPPSWTPLLDPWGSELPGKVSTTGPVHPHIALGKETGIRERKVRAGALILQ